MVLPERILSILKRLKTGGFDAYVVGGATRDYLIGTANYDYDLTTSAKPEDVKALFSDYVIIETGLKHGTVTLFCRDFGNIEITTFRSEGKYSDCRHPEEVKFLSSVTDDLARRDFTVNAIAFSPDEGFVDPFGGIEDLKKKIIKTVGEPRERFEEDALRILRGVRLAAKTGFAVDENTKRAMNESKALLKKVSVERIFSELTRTLCAPFAANAVNEFKEIIFEVIPELAQSDGFDQKSLSHCYDVFGHTVRALDLSKSVDPEVRWALLLHDSGKPISFVTDEQGYRHFPLHMPESEKIAKAVLKRLKAPKSFAERVVALVANHDKPLDDGYKIKKFIYFYGKGTFEQMLEVKQADLYAHSEHGIKKYEKTLSDAKRIYAEILERGDCLYFSDMEISGGDLKDIGFSGKEIGDIKVKLFERVLKNELKNDRAELLAEAKKMKGGLRNG